MATKDEIETIIAFFQSKGYGQPKYFQGKLSYIGNLQVKYGWLGTSNRIASIGGYMVQYSVFGKITKIGEWQF